MLYNRAENPFTAGDVFDVLRHGLSMDMSTAGYLIAVPWLVMLVSFFVKESRQKVVHRVLTVYLGVAAFLVCLILCADCALYPFWKFKLNASIFAYLNNVEGAANSVETIFIVVCVVAFLLVFAVIAGSQLILLQRCMTTRSPLRCVRLSRGVAIGLYVFAAAPIFLAIRGGISTAVQNVGTAYYSQTLFLNHAGVNPVFSLMSSIKRTERYAGQYHYFDDAVCDSIVAGLYAPTPSPGERLLRTERPNILIVMMESFGGKFIETLGGIPGVAPNLNRLVDEGIFFDHYYSNSFRTDRGTVSLFSGWPSYPTVSLMRLPEMLAHMPGLAKTLGQSGYSTEYLYGGDITIMGKSSYLVSSGFSTLYSDKDFSLIDAKSSKWGVCDGISAQRVAEMLAKRGADASHPWLFGYQTLSSHEPFEVPYKRLEDPRLNAFAYTDECVGSLIDALKNSPAWDNLLVILVPDHGFLYQLTYEDAAFFHSPMLWLGGAVKTPQRISTLMNQSDFCATLLGQLSIDHADYPWSRDVLSPDYAEPFVYSTSPSTIVYADSTGTTVYDITSRRRLAGPANPAAAKQGEQRVKALLQHTYRQLDAMKDSK